MINSLGAGSQVEGTSGEVRPHSCGSVESLCSNRMENGLNESSCRLVSGFWFLLYEASHWGKPLTTPSRKKKKKSRRHLLKVLQREFRKQKKYVWWLHLVKLFTLVVVEERRPPPRGATGRGWLLDGLCSHCRWGCWMGRGLGSQASRPHRPPSSAARTIWMLILSACFQARKDAYQKTLSSGGC